MVAHLIDILANGVNVPREDRDAGAGCYSPATRPLPWYPIGLSLFASNLSGCILVGLMGGTCTNGVVSFDCERIAAFALILSVRFYCPRELLTHSAKV